MITHVNVACKTKKAATEFAAAVNEALDLGDDTLATAVEFVVQIEWSDHIDPTELFDALNTARESMDWEYDD